MEFALCSSSLQLCTGQNNRIWPDQFSTQPSYNITIIGPTRYIGLSEFDAMRRITLIISATTTSRGFMHAGSPGKLARDSIPSRSRSAFKIARNNSDSYPHIKCTGQTFQCFKQLLCCDFIGLHMCVGRIYMKFNKMIPKYVLMQQCEIFPNNTCPS